MRGSSSGSGIRFARDANLSAGRRHGSQDLAVGVHSSVLGHALHATPREVVEVGQRRSLG
jgi:hypothetical protein